MNNNVNLTPTQKEILLALGRDLGCDRDGDAFAVIVNEDIDFVEVHRMPHAISIQKIEEED